MQEQVKTNNYFAALAFTFFIAAAFCFFFVPAFIIRPFRQQSSGALTVALALRQLAPVFTLLLVGAALVIAVRMWRRVAIWKRVLLVLGLVLGCAAATMARVDYFEWMFHPVKTPGYESADHAQLDSSEMVMAVRFGSDARAYPIRLMGYHHIVNDIVGGVPIVVTY
jgi:hypothetical protein